jgi:hypothetical protein
MMTVARQPLDADAAPYSQSICALDAVNFFVGGALAGFGPFVALFVGGQGWPPKGYWLCPDRGRYCRLVGAIPRRGVT